MEKQDELFGRTHHTSTQINTQQLEEDRYTIERLNRKLVLREQRIQQLEEEASTHQRKLEEVIESAESMLKDTLIQQSDKFDEAKKTVGLLELEAQTARESASRVQKHNTVLQERTQQQQERIAELTSQLAEWQQEAARRESEFSKLQKQFTATLDTTELMMKETLFENEKTVMKLEAELKEKELVIAKQEQSIVDLETELNGLPRDAVSLRTMIKQQQEQIEQLMYESDRVQSLLKSQFECLHHSPSKSVSGDRSSEQKASDILIGRHLVDERIRSLQRISRR
eukprot:GILK01012518.1.p1 GENE.GILK01012518.1~~GILK01012518.1.p1  ORF type:complete len:284 (-),score=83.01 GILK01012518.1:130-981(-)